MLNTVLSYSYREDDRGGVKLLETVDDGERASTHLITYLYPGDEAQDFLAAVEESWLSEETDEAAASKIEEMIKAYL